MEATATKLVTFTVHGIAQTAGSKQSFVPINPKTGQPYRSAKNGRVVVNTIDDNKKSRPWKSLVSLEAAAAMDGRGLLEGPLRAVFRFYLPRPKSHFKTGKSSHVMKVDAPEFHDKRPDVLKLARAAEDALSGVVYLDDSQIAEETLLKLYGNPPRMEVAIERIGG